MYRKKIRKTTGQEQDRIRIHKFQKEADKKSRNENVTIKLNTQSKLQN